MSDPIRIVIVEDHSLVRAGFRLLLEKVDGFEVIGDAVSAESALELLAERQPDVVVTDIAMGAMNGIQLTEKIRTTWPSVKIIVLSVYKTQQYIESAFSAGASAYLLKESIDAELELAVRAVMEGGTYLSLAVTGAEGSAAAAGNGRIAELTPRQREVLTRIANGMNTKGIAMALGVSPKTIETHRSDLMKRLGIYEVAGLVRLAIREGLVELD